MLVLTSQSCGNKVRVKRVNDVDPWLKRKAMKRLLILQGEQLMIHKLHQVVTNQGSIPLSAFENTNSRENLNYGRQKQLSSANLRLPLPHKHYYLVYSLQNPIHMTNPLLHLFQSSKCFLRQRTVSSNSSAYNAVYPNFSQIVGSGTTMHDLMIQGST